MRLTQIKLAGFKSFVDPTEIPIPGSLVGIVGPNGCGKSNVIDAVRWVLGESQARHLRGETMDDVIFNGAGARKPVGRASVELVFDNSLGKAAGQWSQYAEISVKRVLTRNSESAYYINNLHVRRRDVADVFLGTGLGGRAYAIIEQGMISRIIEAKPEELRVFLEEAAGVSKYRERRRETELRLADTRRNMVRVDDIRRDLARQLEHLTAQAGVAERYHALKKEYAATQNHAWWLKKHEALNQQGRLLRDIARQTIELDAETARLRAAEARLETLRAAHYASADALHASQGALYAANGEVARLEQEIQHQRDRRSRIDQQIGALQSERDRQSGQQQTAQNNLIDWRRQHDDAARRVEETRIAGAAIADGLPHAEQALRGCRSALHEVQSCHAEIEKYVQVEQTRCEHASRILQQLASRSERLVNEQRSLWAPDSTLLQQQRVELSEREERLREARAMQQELEQQLSDKEQLRRDTLHSAEACSAKRAGLDARLQALQLLQQRLSKSDQTSAWLTKNHLVDARRLWQSIQVDPGWENALEAVLRERLNAIAVGEFAADSAWLRDLPNAKIALFGTASAAVPENAQSSDASGASTTLADAVSGRAANSESEAEPLRRYLRCNDATVTPVLNEWLYDVYVVPDTPRALRMRAKLPRGAVLVTRDGAIVDHHSVSFHAPDSELHGVLSRKLEIEQLSVQVKSETTALEQVRHAVNEAELQVEQQRDAISEGRASIDAMQRAVHDMQLTILKLSELSDSVARRTAQIAQELQETAAQSALEAEQHEAAQQHLAAHKQQLEALAGQLPAARQRFNAAEQLLVEQRERTQQAQREAQEQAFNFKTCANKINELEESIKAIAFNIEQVCANLSLLSDERLELDEAGLQDALQHALATRREKELAFSLARTALQEAERQLDQTSQERLACEQKLPPLRDRIQDWRLKEQEARLTAEQFAHELTDAGADEAELAAMQEKGVKSGALQTRLAQLDEAITALGAVNLAAFDELKSVSERKIYLDSQAQDLEEAIATLANAIRRIDRETRERLQVTFDQVNQQLGEMFPTLFGGGHAELVLTGEEILDSGLQVIAQPPGKKNASIHLLSGGEKALTALSLVFSLFQLNPAPFCLLDEVDAPLDDSNTERFCELVRTMAQQTHFLFISHNKITMQMAHQLIGVTMQELGVSRIVSVDIEEAMKMQEQAIA
ncbi:MAG: chromosome segregation protein SMC [Burkholderiales bacterium]|nr:chromosome segregation protein SMC [Burkholderiales bacterium]